VSLDNTSHDGETEAGAVRSVVPTAAGLFASIEPIPDVRKVNGIDAIACVRDGEGDAGPDCWI
jgi:hypothetical protein